ncbi:MAG: arginine--tRNA ligase [Bacteroidales bacterium]|nr:arginine--tRNA ligase [Bacteroidales bacterium]MDY5076157.1 arginine--tRNA ligase [Paludibacteraceae bacterium]
MTIEQTLSSLVIKAVKALYDIDAAPQQVQLQKTRPEFEGNITVVVFPFVKAARKAPAQVAAELGQWLVENGQIVSTFNAVQGFLNLSISDAFWLEQLRDMAANEHYGDSTEKRGLMMVEYSSPNTNKPLHLGHVRNNLLGYSIAQIQEANGWQVVKTNIVNDRGIHICKSMLAWLKFGNGETPETSGKKGDHLIGDYYVRFDKEYKAQVAELVAGGMDEEQAKKEAPLMKEAQAMLLQWEQGDAEVRALWEKMNSWVYAGFDETYKQMGVSFDKIYYESNTYLEGKKEVERGLAEGKFYRRADNSVWADLTENGLDEKLLLRTDGTSVYMTQDIGTAKLRFQDYPIDKMVYVVGNEQEYHFKVLSILLDRLGFPFGKELVHFSYGMVELPNGKMKSREGTVVDADDLMAAMIQDAREISKDKVNTLPDVTPAEAEEIARKVGLGALKYFILKVDPRKNMLFNPAESIDFNGNTGPFIQYTYARIQSVLRKAQGMDELRFTNYDSGVSLNEKELGLIQRLCDFPAVVKQAGDEFSPAVICNYAYALACDFNSFYHDYSILNEPDADKRALRIALSAEVARVIARAMALLGIEVPERM